MYAHYCRRSEFFAVYPVISKKILTSRPASYVHSDAAALPYSQGPISATWIWRDCMTDAEYAQKVDELDRLLNDPDVPMQPDRIWSLLADISQRDLRASTSRLAGVAD